VQHGVRADPHGEAVQVDPMKPMLKAPGPKRLKQECDEPPSNFAFEFNLCRYFTVYEDGDKVRSAAPSVGGGLGDTVGGACIAISYLIRGIFNPRNINPRNIAPRDIDPRNI